MTPLSERQLGLMVEQLTPLGVSPRATFAHAAALVAACEGFGAAFTRHHLVELEHIEKRARQIVEANVGDPALVELALYLVRDAAGNAQRACQP